MQFHEYVNIKQRLLRDAAPEAKQRFKSFDLARFRGTVVKSVMEGCDQGKLYGYQAEAEGIWAAHERPFYNVWPIGVGLARNVQLAVPFSSIRLPCEFSTETLGGGTISTTPLLFRFAKGHEPYGMQTALLDWRHTDCVIQVHVFGGIRSEQFFWERYQPAEQVEQWLDRLLVRKQGQDASLKAYADESVKLEHVALLVRLLVFVALLAKDDDIITPIVLAKDRAKHESAGDPSVKKWLEDRAARKAGRGFDVGRNLQEQKDKSPHWRNPHLCLFWTGEGRNTPVIKMRRGAVIQRVSMADVPTGYLGPETEAEALLPEDIAQREAVSKSKRFEILKRDGYRCQLCGRSQQDGVRLHVDHRIPRAKGGSNEDENLWTLCEDCNLGKSDEDL